MEFPWFGAKSEWYAAPGRGISQHAIALDQILRGLHQLGNVLKDLKKYDESIAYQRKATELSPTDSKPLKNLGMYEDIGMFDDASESFEQDFKIDPGNATAEYNLGQSALDIRISKMVSVKGAVGKETARIKRRH